MAVLWVSLTLSGFGRYKDSVYVSFDSGINVCVAGNETGKTTLAAGLAAVIYGLPASSDPRAFGQARYRNWHRPSRFEGELHFQVENEQYKILRNFSDNRISFQRFVADQWLEEVGGEHKPGARKPNEAYENKVASLLGINSRELFMSTFFVGQPLPDEDKITPEIQQLLSGSGTHYKQALKMLLSQLKMITRYTGRSGITNQDMRSDRELENLELEVAAVTEAIQDSDQTLNQLQETTDGLAKLQKERLQRSEKLQEKETILAGWQSWRNLRDRYDDALRRQNVLIRAVDSGKILQHAMVEKKAFLSSNYSEFIGCSDNGDGEEPVVHDAFDKLGPAPAKVVEDAQEAARRLQENWQEFQTDVLEMKGLESQLSGEFAPFAGVELSLVEQLTGYKATRYRLETEKAKAAAALTQVERQEGEYQAAKEELQQQFADLAALPENSATLITDKLALLEAIREAKSQHLHATNTGSAVWPTAAAFALLVGGATFWLSQLLWLAGVSAVVTAIFIAVYLGQNGKGKQMAKEKQALSQLMDRVDQIDAKLGPFASDSEARLGELRIRLQQREQMAKRVDQLVQHRPAAHILDELTAALEKAIDNKNRFLHQTEPYAKHFDDIEIACRSWRETERRVEYLREKTTSFVHRQGVSVEPGKLAMVSPLELLPPWPLLTSMASIYDVAIDSVEALIHWLAACDDAWWQQAQQDATVFAQQATERLGRRQEAEQLEQEMVQLDKELSGVLRAHGASDLDALQNALTNATNRAVTILRDWEQLIATHPGLPGTEETDPATLDGLYRQLVADVAELRQENIRIQEVIRELEFSQARLLGRAPENIASLQQQLQELTLHRLRLQREAAALALAYTQLDGAIDQYTRSYRQELADKATAIFIRITNNTQRSVKIHEDFDIEVIEEGQAVSVEQLSQGARDQLYIALRLAIADLLAAHVTLPFLLDDPFLNWDEDRLENMRQALTLIGNDRQVILLSHRQEYLSWGISCEIT